MPRFRTAKLALTLPAALAIALSGCGGGDPGIDEEIDVSEPPAASPDPAADTPVPAVDESAPGPEAAAPTP